MHSPSEFVVDLGRIVPGRNEVKIHQRVIMTPLHTKQLLGALVVAEHLDEGLQILAQPLRIGRNNVGVAKLGQRS